MRFFSSLARRPLRWAIAAPAALVLAAGAWWWSRSAEPPPGPSDAALAAADPEVAAAVRTVRDRRCASCAPRKPGACWARCFSPTVLNPTPTPAWPRRIPGTRRAGAGPTCAPPGFPAIGTPRSPPPAAPWRRVSCTGRTEATPYLFLAELDIERGDMAPAAELCRRVLDAEPNNFRAHLDLGLIALTDNDPAECVPHLLRAAESPTTRETAYTQSAAVYQRQGNVAASADYARRAAVPRPTRPGATPTWTPCRS